MSGIRLVPATIAHLAALQSDSTLLGALIGVSMPGNWPTSSVSIECTIDRLRHHPEEAEWWTHFIIDGCQLIGSAGFSGPPVDGVVEIGVDIAPKFRDLGLAATAVEALVEKARAAPSATTVLSHTKPEHSAYTRTLRRLGFRLAGERAGLFGATVWHWELLVTPARPPARETWRVRYPDHRLRAWRAMPFRTLHRPPADIGDGSSNLLDIKRRGGS
jgi:RimJ/RimL family protein N-acetyltransferase